MASTNSLPTQQPDFLFLGGHPAIDFANTFLPPPGAGLEFLASWNDVIAWLKANGLSDGTHLSLAAREGESALTAVRHLRAVWKTVLDEIEAGHDVSPDFVNQINAFLRTDSTSDILLAKNQRFSLQRSPSSLKGATLVLALLARLLAEFLATADFEYLRHCANTDSCSIQFYDTTKNHRRQWCSNSMCGNRHKVAEFRRRQRVSSN